MLPALLTIACTLPKASTQAWISACAPCARADVVGARDGLAARRVDLVDDRLRLGRIDVVDHDAGALGRQRQAVSATDAATAAGHDRAAPVEESHVCLSNRREQEINFETDRTGNAAGRQSPERRPPRARARVEWEPGHEPKEEDPRCPPPPSDPRSESFVARRRPMLIDGRWSTPRRARPSRPTTRPPARCSPHVAEGDREDVDRAVARRAPRLRGGPVAGA